ncbi:MAG TPA: TonB family protein [Candidatus Solibacter sp.]|nr:TonB family protein [Candidatus Solibacter sp.]
MGYQALLFCPDEKTARTVTQVLGDLEFSVETCAEPFAAVKKLMSQHFDALVVDCDNEQNATLLFKSARNSTSNQASLAVAVVEGQAGVAKAFRIGANLVLTKPINVEQAKGTLRVARGLLRKGEPGKPAAAVPAPGTAGSSPANVSPAAAKPVAPKASSPQPVAPPKPVAPTGVAGARSPLPPVPKPSASPVPPRAVTASAAPLASPANDDDLLEINIDDTREVPTAKAPPSAKLPPQIPAPTAESKPAAKPVAAAPAFGSAAAAAPARDVQPAPAGDTVTEPEPLAQQEAPDSDSKSTTGTNFTFGGAAVESEPSGPNKKVLIGVAAAVIAVAGIYLAWSHFSGSKSDTPVSPAPIAASQPVKPAPAPLKPATTPAATSQPAASAPNSQPAPQPVTQATSPKPKDDAEADQPASDEADDSLSSPVTTKSSGKSSAPAKSTPAPLMVKGGAAPSIKKAPAGADAPAPSMIGLATPTTSAPQINMGNSGIIPKPVLQTLNISQGVSQGLLIKKVQPTYPQNALAMHVEGAVNLLATISKSGSITNVKVLGGPALLTHAAVDAVKQWKYKPYLLNGEPVEIQTQVTVNFKLPN